MTHHYPVAWTPKDEMAFAMSWILVKSGPSPETNRDFWTLVCKFHNIQVRTFERRRTMRWRDIRGHVRTLDICYMRVMSSRTSELAASTIYE